MNVSEFVYATPDANAQDAIYKAERHINMHEKNHDYIPQNSVHPFIKQTPLLPIGLKW